MSKYVLCQNPIIQYMRYFNMTYIFRRSCPLFNISIIFAMCWYSNRSSNFSSVVLLPRLLLLELLLITGVFCLAGGSQRVFVAMPNFLVMAEMTVGSHWSSVATAGTSIGLTNLVQLSLYLSRLCESLLILDLHDQKVGTYRNNCCSR